MGPCQKQKVKYSSSALFIIFVSQLLVRSVLLDKFKLNPFWK